MQFGKVFLLREETDLPTIAARLKDFRSEEAFEHEAGKFQLVTEVKNLELTSDKLRGVFARDSVALINQRGKLTPTLRTREAHFTLYEYKEKILLIVLEKKFRANNVANQLSKLLFVTAGRIVEVRIPPETIKAWHDKNFDDTKVITFDDVDVPNVTKLNLYGTALGNTSLYEEYLARWKLWYAVVKSSRFGYVVGVTRNGVIVIFNNLSRDEFLDFVATDVFPLISM